MAWHTVGTYHSAISAFLEPHCHQKASNNPIISKLVHHFLLAVPPSHKCFDPWDVRCFLYLLYIWISASSLTNFTVPWKMATLLVVITVRFCSDLTLLHIDNQYLFLQHHTAIFVPAPLW